MSARDIRIAKERAERKAVVLAALAAHGEQTAYQMSERVGIGARRLSSTLTALLKTGEVQCRHEGYNPSSHQPCVLWSLERRGHALDECWPIPVTLPVGGRVREHRGEM